MALAQGIVHKDYLLAWTNHIKYKAASDIYIYNVQCSYSVVCARVAWDKQHVQDLHIHIHAAS